MLAACGSSSRLRRLSALSGLRGQPLRAGCAPLYAATTTFLVYIACLISNASIRVQPCGEINTRSTLNRPEDLLDFLRFEIIIR